MVADVRLEKLDTNMEAATIGAWLVQVGQVVAAGDKFVELITDKVTFEYQLPVGGTVRQLYGAAGALVPVGFILAQVGDAQAAVRDASAENAALTAALRAAQEVSIDVGAAPERALAATGGRVRATPAARRLAREHGLALEEVAPATPSGIIAEDDVRRHLGL